LRLARLFWLRANPSFRRYYPKLTLDFETNKRICDEIAIIASKRLRNKVRAQSNAASQKLSN